MTKNVSTYTEQKLEDDTCVLLEVIEKRQQQHVKVARRIAEIRSVLQKAVANFTA